jgi:serine protease Do
VLELPVATNGAPPIAEEVLQTDADEMLTTVEVVKLLRPSVVHIGTQSVAIGMAAEAVPEGAGTGIILNETGYILTNNHVVDGAESIIVTLSTGESFIAELVGQDESTDIAIIRIEADGLRPAVLGVSSELKVGEDVIAIGHAFDLRGGPTVTKGVVGALGRSLESSAEFQITIVDLIQTDASINPGNSGGPLVNARAEVVGINTAIIPGGQGIGFAINIDDAKVVAAQLIEHGFVTRGFLSIRPANITSAIASRFGFPVTEGIYVQLVHSGTAADDAFLQLGDIIVQMGDEPIANSGEMAKFLIAHLPGETVDITFYREAEEGWSQVTTEVTLGERPVE